MIKINKKLVLVLIFLSNTLLSQTYDDEIWSGLEIEIPITKKLEMSLEHDIRWINWTQTIDWQITDLGLAYSFNKQFKLSASYNYRSRKDNWQHVFNGNFNYDNNFGKFKYSYRLRYQEKYRWKITKKKRLTERKSDEDHIRNRFMLEYDTDMWLTPFTGAELYYLVNNDEYSDRFDVLRLYLGVDIDTFKDQKLTIYYMAEHEFNVLNPNTSNVIGIFYSFSLPRLFN
ncbi:DUF2490 domain-containing protein [Bacteroidetes/Chlorobi group bacterium ChocPot_Mid]|nr:MAG: DUF2490 domain-containing protein [Bacteroidetes/Chlorobi group bacterium ChocPot_Mid]